MIWRTAQVDDEGEQQQAKDGDDLDGSEDEFRLAVYRNSEDVQADDENDDEGNPCSHIDMLGTVPELNDGRCGRNLGAEGDSAGIPVVPTHGKPHGFIDIASAELRDCTREGKPSRHLAKRHHL